MIETQSLSDVILSPQIFIRRTDQTGLLVRKRIVSLHRFGVFTMPMAMISAVEFVPVINR